MSGAATMVSPSFPFPGPPSARSLYNHPPPPTSNPPPNQTGFPSPPESRRMSGDDVPAIPTTRQSLPSISEALADPTIPYPQSTSSYFQPPASTSVSELHRRSVTSGPPPDTHHAYPPSHPPSHPHSPYMNRTPHTAQAPHTPTSQGDSYSRPALFSSQPPKLPTLQPIKTDTSPTNAFRPNVTYGPSQQPSPAYDTPPQSAPAQPPFGYPGYQAPAFQYPPPPPAPAASGPLYPASAALSAPPKYPTTSGPWENGSIDDRRPQMPVGTYGESVKRHLEEFDLEASLNEVAECSGKMLEFAKVYGVRTHGSQRIGMSPRSMPPVREVEELMEKSRAIEDSLKRIRDMVIAQNHAMEQQLKDPARSGPGGYLDMNGYSDDKQGMGGFAGPDTKKRRGRAAPPGRCHSCNRAETPEWRRGPDGARTLCNACGLHYAKLTRKMGNKAIGSSNLRPKVDA